MNRLWIARTARFLAFAALGTGLFCFVLMSVWNSLVPALFDGPTITFGQALALFVLSRILLLPVRAWWGWRLERRRRSGYFRKRFEEKLAQMTPQERERFRSQYANRCGNRWNCNTSRQEAQAPTRAEEPVNV
jgi:ABC-type nickel/cobalt efflux system permease component RcnA